MLPPLLKLGTEKIHNILDLSDKIVKSKKEENIELHRPCEFSKFARSVQFYVSFLFVLHDFPEIQYVSYFLRP